MPSQPDRNGVRTVPPVPPVPKTGHLRLGDFAQRVVVAVLIGIILFAVAYLVWWGRETLLEVFAGILFGVFLYALTDWLNRWTRLSHGWALTVVVIVLLLLACGLGWLLWSRLAAQANELAQKLPQSLEQIQQYLHQYTWGQALLRQLPRATTSIGGGGGGEFSAVTGVIGGIMQFFVAVLVIVFVGLFGAAEPSLYRTGLLHLVPAFSRPRVGEAIDAIFYNLRWWLLGQIVLMIIIGITTTIGLWGIGIPLALVLGVIAGILEIVPYLGPWLSAVPSALVALLISPMHMVLVLLLYLGLHLLEGYVLSPLIQRRAVRLPPALTLFAQILLGELLGFRGLLVAAPLTATVIVLLKMLYVEDTLGDQTAETAGAPRPGA